MNANEKINSFLEQLKEAANPNKDYAEGYSDIESENSKELKIEINLKPYKNHQAWPGRRYKLIGNSFNLESTIVDTTSDTRRTACISVVLEKGKDNCKCTSIEDAFKYQGFVECLSRFEFDWLSKQPPSTLIGPAYDASGELLPESFAVWKRQLVIEKKLARAKLALSSH